MGWASGSGLYDELIRAAMKYIPDEKIRARFYRDTIKAFEDSDWDTQSECEGFDPVFDKALLKLHPEWERD